MKYICPLKITLPRKTMKDKVYYLNLNNYRNWHYIVSNQLKRRFKELIEPQLKGYKFNKIYITFTFFPKTHHAYDITNVCSVIDKFFCDSLVELGCIEDDSYKYINSVTYKFGKVDKEHPRCEVEIMEKGN